MGVPHINTLCTLNVTARIIGIKRTTQILGNIVEYYLTHWQVPVSPSLVASADLLVLTEAHSKDAMVTSDISASPDIAWAGSSPGETPATWMAL